MQLSLTKLAMFSNHWTLTAIICLIAITAGSPDAFAQTTNEDAGHLKQRLIELNERVLVEYVLHNNTGPLETAARDDFFVVGPAGVESRERVVATVGNLKVDSVSIENTEIRLYGSPEASSAVLAGTLHPRGSLGSRPMPVLSYLSVYVRKGNEWRLAARSLTPLMFGPQDQ